LLSAIWTVRIFCTETSCSRSSQPNALPDIAVFLKLPPSVPISLFYGKRKDYDDHSDINPPYSNQ